MLSTAALYGIGLDNDIYEFGKDFKRGNHHPTAILSWHLSGETEENR
jgi:hypothetical protein